MAQSKQHYLAILLFLGIAVLLHFLLPNIAEIDSFFYFGQAGHYRTTGLNNTDFPWLPYTALGELGGSLWYGFGIFLIPFTYFRNPALGIKIAALLLTTITLMLFYWVLRRHQIRWPFFLTVLFLFIAPNVLYRLLMVRPQLISLGLSVLLLSFLSQSSLRPKPEPGFKPAAHRPPEKKSYLSPLAILMISLAITWLHFNFLWLPLLILLTVSVLSLILERRLELLKSAAVVVGVILGWLLRPDFWNAVHLFYIQVIKQVAEKQAGLPLLFGAENFPLTLNTLFRNFSPLLILWVFSLVVFGLIVFKQRKVSQLKERLFIISSLLLSLIFFVLTLGVARRAYDFWAAFGLLSIGGVFTHCLPLLEAHLKTKMQRFALVLVTVAFLFLLPYSGYKTYLSLQRSASAPDKLKTIALWLQDHSAPHTIVFNLNWSHFSPLFLWNQKNYYVGGLDPVFQYEYNPSLYWKFHYLSADVLAEKTCGAEVCTAEMLEDTYQVLIQDFDARYLILDRRQNPKVYEFLAKDTNRFEKILEHESEVLFAIKRAS